MEGSRLCWYTQCSWRRSRLSTSCRGGLLSAVAALEYVVVGTSCRWSLDPLSNSTAPVALHRPAQEHFPQRGCTGHLDSLSAVTCVPSPLEAGFAVLGTEVPEYLGTRGLTDLVTWLGCLLSTGD